MSRYQGTTFDWHGLLPGSCDCDPAWKDRGLVDDRCEWHRLIDAVEELRAGGWTVEPGRPLTPDTDRLHQILVRDRARFEDRDWSVAVNTSTGVVHHRGCSHLPNPNPDYQTLASLGAPFRNYQFVRDVSVVPFGEPLSSFDPWQSGDSRYRWCLVCAYA